MYGPVPLRIAQERSITIPAGHIVATGYVPVGMIDFACRDRMAVGDVDASYRKRLQLGTAQPWPPPVGSWNGDRFTVLDGRHECVAALMLGCTHVLVAWITDNGA